jgi:hypothetical protein
MRVVLFRHPADVCDIDAEGPHWPVNVPQAVLTEIGEPVGELVTNLVARRTRNANASGLAHCFKAGRDVHSVAKDVIVLYQDVAGIDPNAKDNPAFLFNVCIAIDHPALDVDRTLRRVYDARELDEDAVARRLDDASAVLLDPGINHGATVVIHGREGSFLVGAHQAAVADHIGSENGCEPSLCTRFGHIDLPA